jgi:uncharacterized protein YbaR (Trm112 family)
MEAAMDADLLEVIACPKCKGELEYRPGREFVCHSCRLVYAIVDGIPNFLVDEAQPLGQEGQDGGQDGAPSEE